MSDDRPMKNQPENNPDPQRGRSEEHSELRQQLWELAYGLLDADAEAALRSQIKSDPAVARLYSEVRLQTDLVGRAARVDDSSLQISVGPDSKVSKDSRTRTKAIGKGPQATEARTWGTNWIAVGGTLALLVLLTFGLYQPEAVTNSVAHADYYFTQITAPANTPAGVTQRIEINTTDVNHNGRAAEVALRLVDSEGRETYRQQVKTGANGHAAVDLPGNVLRPGVRLEAIPADEEVLRDRAAAVVSAPLQVSEEQRRAILLLEKPSARPGEVVGFSYGSIGPFSKQLTPPQADELMIEDRTGGDVVQPMWETDLKAGVISGQFAIPSNPTVAVEQLAMRRRAAGKEFQEEGLEKGGDAARKSDVTERQLLPFDRANSLQNANGALAGGYSARGAVARPGEPKAESLAEGGRGFGGGAAGGNPAAAVPAAPNNAPAAASPMNRAGNPFDAPAAAPAAPPAPPAPRAELSPAGQSGAPGSLPGVPGSPAAAMRKQAAPGAPGQAADNVGEGRDAGGKGAVLNGLAAPSERPPADKSLPNPGAEPSGHPADKPALETFGTEKAGAQKLGTSGDKPGLMKAQPAPLATRGLGATKDRNHADVLEPAATVEKAKQDLAAAIPQLQSSAGEVLPRVQDLRDVPVPADLAGQDLVLVARRAGTVIARRELAAGALKDQALALPPEVDGRVTLQFFRKGEAQPAFEQEVLRSAVRELHFEVSGLQESYQPGDKVRLEVRVRDERRQPAAAAVAVRVWNDLAARATHKPLLLVDMLSEDETLPQLGTLAVTEENAAPRDRSESAKAQAFAAMVPQPEAGGQPMLKSEAKPAPAEIAAAPSPTRPMKRMADAEADKVVERETKTPTAETQVGESFFVEHQVVADNRAVVQQEYEAAVAARQAEYFQRIRSVGRTLVWAGAGLLLLLGILLMASRPLKTVVLVPAICIAVVSLALGIAWFVPPQPAGWQMARLSEPERVEAVSESGAAAVNGEVTKLEANAPGAPETAIAELTATPPLATDSADRPEPTAEALKRIAPENRQSDALRNFGPAGGAPGATQLAAPPGKPGDSQRQAAIDEKANAAEQQQANAQKSLTSGAKAPEQAKKATERLVRDGNATLGSEGQETAPDSLFWRPLSMIESNGTLTIEFTMPAVEAEYRLLLDAVGNGRMGGLDQPLICRER